MGRPRDISQRSGAPAGSLTRHSNSNSLPAAAVAATAATTRARSSGWIADSQTV